MTKLHLALVCAACFFLSSCGASKSNVEASAKEVTQQIINENEALKSLGIVVDRVDAIKESDNKYQGLAQVTLDGEHHQVPISILADGDKILVTTEKGAFAFAAQVILKKALDTAAPLPQAAPMTPAPVQQNESQKVDAQPAQTVTAATETVLPSFDCKKAASVAEKLICADSDLSTMDAELAGLYYRARAAAVDKAAFNDENKARWKQREAECTDKSCLVAWYTLRKGELQAWLKPQS